MKRSSQDCVGEEINGLKIVNYRSEGKRRYFDCICVCGKSFIARTDGIKAGAVKSCGCLTGDLISSQNRLPNNQGATNIVLRYYKRNAKKRELKFLLAQKEFEKLIFGTCYYCGSEPTPSVFVSSAKGRRDRVVVCNGIDRIDSDDNYTITNCVSCCQTCNRAKSDLSLDDFLSWIKKIARFNA